MEKNDRIKWIDILKAIAIILVVVGHIYNNDFAYKLLYSFHLPIFMFVSGWLYQKQKIGENIRKKATSILIPYFIFGILEIIYFILIESKFRDINLTVIQCLQGLFTGYRDFLEFNVHLWYLPFIFFVMVFYNILYNLGGNKLARSVSLILGIIYVFVDIPRLPLSINRFDLIFYFALGEFANNTIKFNNILKESNLLHQIIGFIAFLGLTIIMNYFDLTNYGLNYIIGIFGILSFICVAKILEEKDIILYKIGYSTLIVLCMHGPIYRVLIKLISIPLNISTEMVRDNLILSLIITFITTAMCYFVYKILLRYLPFVLGKKKMKIAQVTQ